MPARLQEILNQFSKRKPPAEKNKGAAHNATPADAGKWSGYWNKIRADWKKGASEEKPDSFLVRAFKKAFFIGTAAATLAFGSTFIIGKWEQQALTQLLGKDSYTLDVDSPPQTGGKGMPLFIGSADIGRVMMMQENLLTLGLPLGPCGADGLMKAEDLRAVNRFRAALGLPPGNFVDAGTLRTLARFAARRRALQGAFETAPETMPLKAGAFDPPLSEKMRIRRVQTDLYQMHYNIGVCKLDGVMNADTVNAVMAFQENRMHRHAITNGEVDSQTLAALDADAFPARKNPAAAMRLSAMTAIVYQPTMTPNQINALALKYMREKGVPQYVVQGIEEAVRRAGFDFSYLMDLASIESDYRPWANAGTSSATGPFQFTDTTWLSVFKKYGGKYGYKELADSINSHTLAEAKKGDAKAEYILGLRGNPRVAALIAIEFSKANLAYLQEHLSGQIGKTELYLAHFFGPADAVKFLRGFRADYKNPAAPHFSRSVVKANRGIFYTRRGKPRSYGEIYSRFARQMSGEVLHMAAPQNTQKFTGTPVAGMS